MYAKTTWVDEVTPTSAGNLNNIEQGIADAHAGLIDQMTGVTLNTAAFSYAPPNNVYQCLPLAGSNGLGGCLVWNSPAANPRVYLFANYDAVNDRLINTAKPGWRLRLDAASGAADDRFDIARAAPTAGAPAWVNIATLIGGGGWQTKAAGAFRAHLAAASAVVAQNGVIPFETVTGAGFDVSGWFDTALHRWVPQLAGYWRVSAACVCQTTGLAADEILEMALRKSGTVTVWGPTYAYRGSTTPSLMVTDVIQVNGTTDYIDAILWNSAAGNVTVGGGNQNTVLMGEFLGT